VHVMIYNNINENQKISFHAIMESVDSNQGKQIFVEGLWEKHIYGKPLQLR
jgi:hypothetical protein